MREQLTEVRHVMYPQSGSGPGPVTPAVSAGRASGPATHPEPTLVLAGADDPIIRWARNASCARCCPRHAPRVCDDGHLRLMTFADELGTRVSRFLTSGEGRCVVGR